MIRTSPIAMNTMHFHIGSLFLSSSEDEFFLVFTIRKAIYPINTITSTNPIGLVTIATSRSTLYPMKCPPKRTEPQEINNTMIVVKIAKGKSLFKTIPSTGKGLITAQTPSTPKRLNIFEPTTLLSAISLAP